MLIKYGYRIEAVCLRETPMIAMLEIHPDELGAAKQSAIRAHALADGSAIKGTHPYRDPFGNQCMRFVAPVGGIMLASDGILAISGRPDPTNPQAIAIAPQHLPDETLIYVLGSRYCDTDMLTDFAWGRFGMISAGWNQVKAVCDFVHGHLRFDYLQARHTRSASQGFAEQVGVCRDFAHLAITLCRCLNIPARYCTGYLGDIGVPIDPNPMDFSAWFEAYLDGKWWTFDARHNKPRIGRIVMARGRDATDVPILHSFGPHILRRFEVVTEEMFSDAPSVKTGEANHSNEPAKPKAAWFETI